MFKTEIKLTVLSREPIPDESDVAAIVAEATDGDYSMGVTETKSERVSPKQMADLALAQGSDPEFFGIDSEGRPVED